jgi:hypothetical protein
MHPCVDGGHHQPLDCGEIGKVGDLDSCAIGGREQIGGKDVVTGLDKAATQVRSEPTGGTGEQKAGHVGLDCSKVGQSGNHTAVPWSPQPSSR